MVSKGIWTRVGTLFVVLSLLLSFISVDFAAAQEPGPSMLHPRLDVRPVISGLTTPTTMAFLGDNEFLVLEKNTGIVQYVVDGAIHHSALDLAVNFFSERGLLGIALDPDFDSNHFVYLYWSCQAPAPTDPFTPSLEECVDTPELGADSEDPLAVPLLGNRVDRFVWDGENLTFDMNLIKLRSFQNDAAPEPPGQGDETQPPRGNHDGGVLAFGQDGKLYIFIGDVGRRGQLQNLPCGPVAECSEDTVPDDQFGGPEPDDAHLTGVILRLNPDGTAPDDNPFFEAGADMGGEVGENIQKIFSYGHRNSFGLTVDPVSGGVWLQENGDDSFSELNLVTPGMNAGWIQIMGPVDRLAEFREIETTFSANPAAPPALQQLRWPPTNIAETPEEALDRLFMLPGAEYRDPAFSWKWEVAPGGMGFVDSRELGSEFRNDLFVGAATPLLEGGYLFHFDLSRDRDELDVDDPLLEDRVADNLAKHEITESESLLIGRNFGAITDIETGPNGNLFVVSLTQGTVYEIFRVNGDGDTRTFTTELSGAEEVPGPGDPDGSGTARIELNPSAGEVCFELTVADIELPATGAHIHQAPAGEAGPVVVPLTPPDESGSSSGCVSDVDRSLIRNIIRHPENYYVNVHNAEFPDGAVRGQLKGEDDDDDDDDVRSFTTELTGEAEVPGPGDPDGSGTAKITLNRDEREVCFELMVSDIELPATGAHIHQAPAGEAGPVVVPLTPPDEGGSSSGCVSDVDRGLIRNIIQHPENYYVNVHNEEFPDGAVRGQLKGEDDDDEDDDDARSFTTDLSGEAEVPGPGDPDGSGTAKITLNTDKREVCFELSVSDIEPATAAHIHEGSEDVAGPVVVPLDPPPTDGSSDGCVSDVDRGLIRNIMQHPENYYVNVHNEEFPDGAVRGQLKGEDDDDEDDDDNRNLRTEMSGEEEAPGPGDPDGSGTARIRLNPDEGEVCFELTVADIEPATAAHIHEAPPGEPGPVVVPLTAPDEDGSSSGCVSDVDRGLIRNIIRSPENYYVNVHNDEFPDGAVRGQLQGGDDDDDGEDNDDAQDQLTQ